MSKAEDIVDATLDNPESDEPVFVFRAKDKHSVEALKAYMMACISDPGCSWTFINSVGEEIRKFVGWQHFNKSKVKVPD